MTDENYLEWEGKNKKVLEKGSTLFFLITEIEGKILLSQRKKSLLNHIKYVTSCLQGYSQRTGYTSNYKNFKNQFHYVGKQSIAFRNGCNDSVSEFVNKSAKLFFPLSSREFKHLKVYVCVYTFKKSLLSN